MKRATLPSVNKERFAFMFASLVGRKVSVKLRSLTSYEGLFSGCNMDKGEYTVLLKFARELPSENRASGPVLDQMLIPGKEIVMMNAIDVPEEGVEGKVVEEKPEFRTDSEVNARSRFQPRGERNLESWADLQEDTAQDASLETHSAGWSNPNDQFLVAKQMGVVSTYREDLYTTPLDYSRLTQEQKTRADRIAKEIEGGRNFASQEEGGEGDEEARFSAVIGTGGYKKPATAHPSETANSWRRGEVVETANNRSNTRLNALNLEPATMRAPAEVRPKSSAIAPPPRPLTPTSEMKGINALNLEPASVTRPAAWDGKFRGAARPAPPAAQPTKKDFEIALAEIKSREQRSHPASATVPGKGKGKGASPSRAEVAAMGPGGKFSFNPNASTFTPGTSGAAGNTLSIAITPGGSLSGTLKSANYDYYEAGAPAGAPPMMMFPGMMPPMPPFAMPPVGPPPAFAPLVDSAQVEKVTVTEMVSRFVDKSASSTSSTTEWSDAKNAAPSFKEILGPLPQGVAPMAPPMMPPMPPMPMMAPGYGMPYPPYFQQGRGRGQFAPPPQFAGYMGPPPPQFRGGFRGQTPPNE